MANVFDLSNSYAQDQTINPQWMMAVVRLRYPASLDHASFKSVTAAFNGVDERGSVMVINSDCLSMTIANSKGSHVKTLSAVLKQGLNNYLLEIMPGDWVLAWIVNSQSKADDLFFRISSKVACNEFDDGLKFVGRIQSVRKSLQQDTASGIRSVTYSLQATSFAELNSMMFHEAALEDADERIGAWFAKINRDFNEIFLTDARGIPSNNGHKLVPTFLNILVGQGLPQSAAVRVGSPAGDGKLTSIQTTYGAVSSKEAPFAYLVPATVGKLLGKTQPSKSGGILSYADLVDMMIGIQSYPAEIPAGYGPLVPVTNESYPEARLNRWYTNTPEVLGAFWPTNVSFTNKPLWSLLEQFVNQHVNELYTCMRVNPLGKVVPTIVLRQQPFTTPVFNEPSLQVTRFTDLARWKLSSSMVSSVDIGRSDNTRFNFVHVYGQDSYAGDNVALSKQVVINPPIRDDLDIQRSGLRPYTGTVACKLVDVVGRVPTTWIKLIADFNMGGHLHLNGTISSFGIQEPICEGDNVEWDGVIFHIESVQHSCTFDTSSGKRTFRTSLSLTHGMSANAGQSDNVTMYAGMPGATTARVDGFDPGLSYEGGDSTSPTLPETTTESTEGPDGAPYASEDEQASNAHTAIQSLLKEE